ncbi:MAG: insulinase family protein [Paludibacteraceae bacterium]|nr:insulinase family protein [Paludibacteraceae bacterium]
MRYLHLLLLIVLATCLHAQSREGLSEYTLDNGLKVILWEDHDQPDVEGYVAVKAGAVDEPAEYTGLAHYLEHMLFKGTDRIGALDWEKERPHYEEIIRLYDQYSETTDDKLRAELATKINQESMESAKYSTCEDFFILMDGIGATDVNAFTSYDMTCYHNSFPAGQMYKWLTIFADRLRNPVFRTFQAELENVFEEYNMYQDNPQTQIREKLFEKMYAGCPYERNVIGKPEHLKNPRLSKLIEFYNTWYVPNNMALILVGDFSAEEVKPLIAKTFGTMESKPLPERPTYAKTSYAGNPKHTFRLGYYPLIYWAYDGVAVDDKDAIALQFVTSLLSNGSNTGLFDRLVMDGQLQSAQASFDARRNQGRVLIQAIPYYDANQQQYDSNAATEKLLQTELNKLISGDIPDWLIQSVKDEFAYSYKVVFESPYSKMSNLVQCFIYDLPLDFIFNQLEQINALTKEDIQRVAKKYFDANYMTVTFNEGDPKKNKLTKPAIQPLNLINGVETDYAKSFKQLPQQPLKQTFLDLNAVKVQDMDKNVHLHYVTNPKNDIFSISLRYGVGTERRPMLQYVTQLMNCAGIMPATTPQDFRRELSALGGFCSYDVSGSYFTVAISGKEENLEAICQLVQRQMLFPKFEERQFDAIKGSALSQRFMMQKMDDVQPDALMDYVLYGDSSHYLRLLPFKEIYYMDEVKLKTQFLEATKYELDVYYCGARPMEEVKSVLAANLPMQEGVIESSSPVILDRKTYDKTQIYFLPNAKVQQASIYFYFNGTPYSKDDAVLFQAFNQYFSGGFTGLVLDEIREKRSMAYTAGGSMHAGRLPGKNAYFRGSIGTQSDKVADAIDVFMHLLDSMPEYPERIETVKAQLRQQAQAGKPTFRNMPQTYDLWQEIGYEIDPAQYNMERINSLTFDDIMRFYKDNIQGKPVTIMIVGDPKLINQKQLQQHYGKLIKVSANRLFSSLDLDFLPMPE